MGISVYYPLKLSLPISYFTVLLRPWKQLLAESGLPEIYI